MPYLANWNSAVGLPTTTAGNAIDTSYVYRFLGAKFDSAGDTPIAPGAFTLGNQITGWIAVDGLLAPNLKVFSAGWQTLPIGISYEFDTSRGNLSGQSPYKLSWTVSTDATGKITEWYVSASAYISVLDVPIGATFSDFSSKYEIDFAHEGPWGQDQAGFGIRLDYGHAYSDSAVSSNKPGRWLAPVEITSGTLLGETINGTNLSSILNGFAGNDTIYGRNGSDEIHGGSGSDRLFGGNGDDIIWGDRGNDRIVGGPGADLLFGGTGADTFLFALGAGKDKIADFELGLDKIRFTSGATSSADLHFQDFTGGTRINFGDVTVAVLHHTALEMNVIDNFVFG